jgi:SAM-dependent methyltransferase
MLSKLMPISQLPSDVEEHLRPVGEFYMCTQKDEIGPPVAMIGRNVYYRFMDFIYLPQPPESLLQKQVIKICDLRLEHLEELVDARLNERIVAAAATQVESNFLNGVGSLKALDFGCGSGLSLKLLKDNLPDLQLVGVDISKKAINQCKEKGLNVVRTRPDRRLPFSKASFDLIFAIFVMHFNVGMFTLKELRRVLRPSGKFVFNVYQRDIEGVIDQLQEAGFRSIEASGIEGVNANHVIVSCCAPASQMK